MARVGIDSGQARSPRPRSRGPSPPPGAGPGSRRQGPARRHQIRAAEPPAPACPSGRASPSAPAMAASATRRAAAASEPSPDPRDGIKVGPEPPAEKQQDRSGPEGGARRTPGRPGSTGGDGRVSWAMAVSRFSARCSATRTAPPPSARRGPARLLGGPCQELHGRGRAPSRPARGAPRRRCLLLHGVACRSAGRRDREHLARLRAPVGPPRAGKLLLASCLVEPRRRNSTTCCRSRYAGDARRWSAIASTGARGAHVGNCCSRTPRPTCIPEAVHTGGGPGPHGDRAPHRLGAPSRVSTTSSSRPPTTGTPPGLHPAPRTGGAGEPIIDAWLRTRCTSGRSVSV
jgi:hypothetical protein